MAEIKLDTKYIDPRFYLKKGQELKEHYGLGISGATAKADRERKVGTTKTVKRFGGKVGKRTVIWDGKKWVEGNTLPKKTLTKQDLKIKGFPTIEYETGKDASPAASVLNPEGYDLGIAQQPSRLGSGAFGDKYTPTEWLKEELGPTKQEGTGKINTGSGKFATWRPGNEKNQALQKAFKKQNQTTTTTTKPSNSRELRIKNFKPSSIQKKLISSGFTPAELVDLQIKHEDWQKNRGR